MRPHIFATVLRTHTPLVLRSSNPHRFAGVARRAFASGHQQETYEEFTDRYVGFFDGALDLFEVQRGLNNCFSHDLVPSPAVIEAALRAARRVNDYATAVRVFEGIREKVENKEQYKAYLEDLKGVRKELGIDTVEELYPQ